MWDQHRNEDVVLITEQMKSKNSKEKYTHIIAPVIFPKSLMKSTRKVYSTDYSTIFENKNHKIKKKKNKQ